MRVVRGPETGSAGLARGAVATIGNYDGIHLGQQALIERVVERARELGAPAVAISFEPHPLRVLDPPRAPARLTTDAQRERLLAALGLDALILLPFDARMAARSAASFARETLGADLGLREVYVGSQFAFGRGREGDPALLARVGREAGFSAYGLPELRVGDAPVSASRIRAQVAAGDVAEAALLLGRPYSLTGRVVAGERRGRELGFPTLNLDPDGELLPGDGVYVSEVDLLGETSGTPEERLAGVTNVGTRPTVDGSGRRQVESHLLDFDRDLYGRAIEVRFLARIRPERHFPSLEALKEGIAADAGFAREYFAGRPRSDRRGPMPRSGSEPHKRL